MQFQYNSDYPDLSSASAPLEFPPANPIPCARITTRVFHPTRNQVATVQNVLVRTMNTLTMGGNRMGNHENDDVDSMSSNMSSSSSSSSDDDSMNLDDDDDDEGASRLPQQLQKENDANEIKHAYWIQRTIREAIYGRVLLAVILKRRSRSLALADGAEWEVTPDHCAVKEMSWQHIRRERDRLAEDPIKEVSSMEYLNRWWQQSQQRKSQQEISSPLNVQQQFLQSQQQQQQQQQQLIPSEQRQQFENNVSNNHADVTQSFLDMRNTNIMMPLDLLSDERNLYSIMPYCDGGELFERLDINERFSENEARYWMDQLLNVSPIGKNKGENTHTPLYPNKRFSLVLLHIVNCIQGLENLQKIGICHRDMSLENLLVHKDSALIIDMGMCLLVPYCEEDPASLALSFDNMRMNGGQGAAVAANNPQVNELLSQNQKPRHSSLTNFPPSGRLRRRSLIRPQGTCGKWIYMSPEIYRNEEPFDGFAVDMWAAGVILFLMLTGFPPWERACPTDERFHYMTAGYLVQMLTEWEIGLSSDSMDLLQRMLFLDPKDRLSLDQVRAHPWMVNGCRDPPIGLNQNR